MAALIQRPDYLQAGQRLLSAPLAARWQRKLLDALARYHEQHRDEPGHGRERLRRIALPMEDEALVLLLIEQMRERQSTAITAGCICRSIKPGLPTSSRRSGIRWRLCSATIRGGCAILRAKSMLKSH